jgi:hypothetical protein
VQGEHLALSGAKGAVVINQQDFRGKNEVM